MRLRGSVPSRLRTRLMTVAMVRSTVGERARALGNGGFSGLTGLDTTEEHVGVAIVTSSGFGN